MNRVEKKQFTIDRYTLENGATIPVTLGYETYGELNEDKSNVVLVAHYFSASSHAAGKYSPEDEAPGYWDHLIGPGKAVDTNKYFVISTDNLANVQEHNPHVITTGPRSINPETGERWGMDFPAYTFRDVAGIQHEFLTKQLGIEKLHAVMGASAGGFISLNWAVHYPDMVERLIGVITNPQNPVITSFTVLQQAMRAIELDPKWQGGNYADGEGPDEGLYLAIQMMNAGAFTAELYEETYKRNSNEQEPYQDIRVKTSYEQQLYDAIKAGAPALDASHWYYTCRATMMHDIAHGIGTLEDALQRIQAKVLMVSCTRDLLQPTVFNRQMVDILKQQGKDAELVEIESLKGHMAGVLDGHLFSEDVERFLNK
ncbi:alpha/beta fold hydrolase [Pontibacillus litoralis]|uniref:Probable acyltransferase n=1 Tax=Pontibacillus litoralis JSM 072002 TaxID=1385512 RepID=A0A0A5G0J0_9BACI|nr:homoserine O-acetyltransferase [Pontibacillus litoralis]KGX86621.1 homoserine O-acetyltransferase [Pontibacillus litoralis JSM 072002]